MPTLRVTDALLRDLCADCYGVVDAATASDDSLDDAWAEAQDAARALPYPAHVTGPGAHWRIDVYQKCHDRYVAVAHQDVDDNWNGIAHQGPTPAAALRGLRSRMTALAEKLRERAL